MTHVIQRLEQAVRFWEATFRLKALSARRDLARKGMNYSGPLIGPFEHWRYLRRYLQTFDGTRFDRERFTIQNPPHDRTTQDDFAAALAAWTSNSRQVFHLSADLSAMLELTVVGDLTWSDVSFPYDAFAITLERPIIGADGGLPYDCLLVTRRLYSPLPEIAGPDGFDLRLIPATLDTVVWTTPEKWNRLERLAEMRRWDTLQREIAAQQIYDPSARFGMTQLQCNVNSTEPIPFELEEEEVTRYVPPRFKADAMICGLATGVAMRIVVGLCMYLTTLPTKSKHRRPVPTDSLGSASNRSIIASVSLCEVTYDRTLTCSDRQAIGDRTQPKSYSAMSPHWRRGHWRKPPGKANDPEAKKTVWVRPCRVRWDRLEEGALAPGGEQHVG